MQKIMFNDRYGLTQAVIEGRKTMTRRLIPDEFFGLTWDTRGNTLVYENEYGDFIDVRLSKYTRYKVGEIVAVAQNYFSTYDESKWENGIWYNEFADGSDITNHAGWLNKMLVKAEYMPHQIRITGIRCERLQDISDEECLREGIRQFTPNFPKNFPIHPTHFVIGDILKDTPREAFASLIDKVYGRGTWKSNPWVVVYEFELVK
jgi:hypothetical protein